MSQSPCYDWGNSSVLQALVGPAGLIQEPEDHLGFVHVGVRVGGERNRDSHALEVPTTRPYVEDVGLAWPVCPSG